MYADATGRVRIALAINRAIREGRIKDLLCWGGPSDVRTDSPLGKRLIFTTVLLFTADMAVHNVIDDSGATGVAAQRRRVGWGEVVNGGFGLVIDGSETSDRQIKSMLFWDVNNGIARRAWARNKGALAALERAMEEEPLLKVTVPVLADPAVLEAIDSIYSKQ